MSGSGPRSSLVLPHFKHETKAGPGFVFPLALVVEVPPPPEAEGATELVARVVDVVEVAGSVGSFFTRKLLAASSRLQHPETTMKRFGFQILLGKLVKSGSCVSLSYVIDCD